MRPPAITQLLLFISVLFEQIIINVWFFLIVSLQFSVLQKKKTKITPTLIMHNNMLEW
jgi:type II secretory pathway component PulF